MTRMKSSKVKLNLPGASQSSTSTPGMSDMRAPTRNASLLHVGTVWMGLRSMWLVRIYLSGIRMQRKRKGSAPLSSNIVKPKKDVSMSQVIFELSTGAHRRLPYVRYTTTNWPYYDALFIDEKRLIGILASSSLRIYKRRHTHTDKEYDTSCEKRLTR